jgi:parvulin-like peptidyl-prolyl isomerase
MGIDKDDPIIRRRLRQKMETYTDNLATTLAPSEDELNQYLQQHPDKFKTQSRYSFQQVYINTDISEDQLQAKLTSTQNALQSGESVDGDSAMLPASFTDADAFAIDRTFGQGFAAQLDTLKLNQWSSPLQSGLGLHFVMLSARQAGQLPTLASVRDKVEREWRFDKAQEIDKTLRKKLLASYDVVVTADESRL